MEVVSAECVLGSLGTCEDWWRVHAAQITLEKRSLDSEANHTENKQQLNHTFSDTDTHTPFTNDCDTQRHNQHHVNGNPKRPNHRQENELRTRNGLYKFSAHTKELMNTADPISQDHPYTNQPNGNQPNGNHPNGNQPNGNNYMNGINKANYNGTVNRAVNASTTFNETATINGTNSSTANGGGSPMNGLEDHFITIDYCNGLDARAFGSTVGRKPRDRMLPYGDRYQLLLEKLRRRGFEPCTLGDVLRSRRKQWARTQCIHSSAQEDFLRHLHMYKQQFKSYNKTADGWVAKDYAENYYNSKNSTPTNASTNGGTGSGRGRKKKGVKEELKKRGRGRPEEPKEKTREERHKDREVYKMLLNSTSNNSSTNGTTGTSTNSSSTNLTSNNVTSTTVSGTNGAVNGGKGNGTRGRGSNASSKNSSSNNSPANASSRSNGVVNGVEMANGVDGPCLNRGQKRPEAEEDGLVWSSIIFCPNFRPGGEIVHRYSKRSERTYNTLYNTIKKGWVHPNLLICLIRDATHPVRFATPPDQDCYTAIYTGPEIGENLNTKVIFGEYTGVVYREDSIPDSIFEYAFELNFTSASWVDAELEYRNDKQYIRDMNGTIFLPNNSKYVLDSSNAFNELSMVNHCQSIGAYGGEYFVQANCEWQQVIFDGWPHVILTNKQGVKIQTGDELIADFGALWFQKVEENCHRQLKKELIQYRLLYSVLKKKYPELRGDLDELLTTCRYSADKVTTTTNGTNNLTNGTNNLANGTHNLTNGTAGKADEGEEREERDELLRQELPVDKDLNNLDYCVVNNNTSYVCAICLDEDLNNNPNTSTKKLLQQRQPVGTPVDGKEGYRDDEDEDECIVCDGCDRIFHTKCLQDVTDTAMNYVQLDVYGTKFVTFNTYLSNMNAGSTTSSTGSVAGSNLGDHDHPLTNNMGTASMASGSETGANTPSANSTDGRSSGITGVVMGMSGKLDLSRRKWYCMYCRYLCKQIIQHDLNQDFMPLQSCIYINNKEDDLRQGNQSGNSKDSSGGVGGVQVRDGRPMATSTNSSGNGVVTPVMANSSTNVTGSTNASAGTGHTPNKNPLQPSHNEKVDGDAMELDELEVASSKKLTQNKLADELERSGKVEHGEEEEEEEEDAKLINLNKITNYITKLTNFNLNSHYIDQDLESTNNSNNSTGSGNELGEEEDEFADADGEETEYDDEGREGDETTASNMTDPTPVEDRNRDGGEDEAGGEKKKRKTYRRRDHLLVGKYFKRRKKKSALDRRKKRRKPTPFKGNSLRSIHRMKLVNRPTTLEIAKYLIKQKILSINANAVNIGQIRLFGNYTNINNGLSPGGISNINNKIKNLFNVNLFNLGLIPNTNSATTVSSSGGGPTTTTTTTSIPTGTTTTDTTAVNGSKMVTRTASRGGPKEARRAEGQNVHSQIREKFNSNQRATHKDKKVQTEDSSRVYGGLELERGLGSHHFTPVSAGNTTSNNSTTKTASTPSGNTTGAVGYNGREEERDTSLVGNVVDYLNCRYLAGMWQLEPFAVFGEAVRVCVECNRKCGPKANVYVCRILKRHLGGNFDHPKATNVEQMRELVLIAYEQHVSFLLRLLVLKNVTIDFLVKLALHFISNPFYRSISTTNSNHGTSNHNSNTNISGNGSGNTNGTRNGNINDLLIDGLNGRTSSNGSFDTNATEENGNSHTVGYHGNGGVRDDHTDISSNVSVCTSRNGSVRACGFDWEVDETALIPQSPEGPRGKSGDQGPNLPPLTLQHDPKLTLNSLKRKDRKEVLRIYKRERRNKERLSVQVTEFVRAVASNMRRVPQGDGPFNYALLETLGGLETDFVRMVNCQDICSYINDLASYMCFNSDQVPSNIQQILSKEELLRFTHFRAHLLKEPGFFGNEVAIYNSSPFSQHLNPLTSFTASGGYYGSFSNIAQSGSGSGAGCVGGGLKREKEDEDFVPLLGIRPGRSILYRKFSDGYYQGIVSNYPNSQYFKIEYSDGDDELMDPLDLLNELVANLNNIKSILLQLSSNDIRNYQYLLLLRSQNINSVAGKDKLDQLCTQLKNLMLNQLIHARVNQARKFKRK